MKSPIDFNTEIPHTESHEYVYDGSVSDTLLLLRAVTIERGEDYVYDMTEITGSYACEYYAMIPTEDGGFKSDGSEAGCAIGLAVKFLDPAIDLRKDMPQGVVTATDVVRAIEKRGITVSPEGLALFKTFQSAQDHKKTYREAYAATRIVYSLMADLTVSDQYNLPSEVSK